LLQEASIEELAELLQRPNRGVARSALVELQPKGIKPPLFLVHGIGGEMASYIPLAHCLSPDQPVYGFHQLQAPTTDREGLPLSVPAMAAAYLEELLAFQPQELFLGGYSFGAIVAFEMAQQLVAKGKRVALLAVIDEFEPDPGWRASWTVRRIASFFHNIPFWLRYEFLPSSFPVHYARLARAARRFKHKLAKHQGRSAGQALEQDVADLFPVARLPESFRLICEANYRALMDYRPQPYPDRITLFKARSQPLVCRHGADLGWGRLAGGGLTTRIIPGTHDSILKEPHVRLLAEEFKAAMAVQPVMEESRSSTRL
jgi:thioesterase domain-containing protein